MASSSKDSQEQGGPHPIHVLMLGSEWGSSKGGLSTINRELAINLAKCPELQVTLYVPHCNDEEKRAARNYNIDLREAKEVPGMDKLQWLSVPPDDLPIDVVVGHGEKLGPQAALIRRSRNCKWLQVVHTVPEELAMHKKYLNPISSGGKKHQALVKLCDLADAVMTIGPKLHETIRSYLRSSRNYEEVFNFTPGIFSELSYIEQNPDKEGKFRVLLFGRGDAEDFELKGFDIAAKAVSKLSNTRLVYIGAPHDPEKADELATCFLKNGIPAECLTVREFITKPEDLRKVFCEVDLAIMPSRTEGFGLAGLEALSAGLPVLVSQNSGFGEALSRVSFGSFFVVDSNDAQVWADKIKSISDKDRKRRLKETEELRTSYTREYCWRKQTKELVGKLVNMSNEEEELQAKAVNRVDAETQTNAETTGVDADDFEEDDGEEESGSESSEDEEDELGAGEDGCTKSVHKGTSSKLVRRKINQSRGKAPRGLGVKHQRDSKPPKHQLSAEGEEMTVPREQPTNQRGRLLPELDKSQLTERPISTKKNQSMRRNSLRNQRNEFGRKEEALTRKRTIDLNYEVGGKVSSGLRVRQHRDSKLPKRQLRAEEEEMAVPSEQPTNQRGRLLPEFEKSQLTGRPISSKTNQSMRRNSQRNQRNEFGGKEEALRREKRIDLNCEFYMR